MHSIGIDLGGTNIVAAVIDKNNKILAKESCKTALPRPSDEIAADMARLAASAAKTAGIDMSDISHVGIGSPGVCNTETGVVEYSCNLGFKNFPLRDKMENLLNKRVYIENDANAAAYGEFIVGAAKGSLSCICVTLGTGVGGGIILDGKIYSGINFAGAELGHIVIDMNGEPCACGRKGCWEAYASATALIRQTKRAMEKSPDSLMWQYAKNIDTVNGKTAFDAMRAGDPDAKKVVDDYIYYIACGLINVINIFQPEIVCIGGGICKEGNTLTDPLEKYINSERYSRFCQKQAKLVTANLGNDAGLLGASLLNNLYR